MRFLVPGTIAWLFVLLIRWEGPRELLKDLGTKDKRSELFTIFGIFSGLIVGFVNNLYREDKNYDDRTSHEASLGEFGAVKNTLNVILEGVSELRVGRPNVETGMKPVAPPTSGQPLARVGTESAGVPLKKAKEPGDGTN